MKIEFPRYETSFVWECTLQEATEKIFKTIKWKSNNLKLIKASYSGVQKIVLSAGTGSFLYYNSFLPITTIEIREENEVSHISMQFELKKSIKAFMVLYCVVGILFEVGMLLSYLSELHAINFSLSLSSPWPLLMPLGMILYCILLCFIGLKVSSKKVLDILFFEFTQGSENKLPKIHKS